MENCFVIQPFDKGPFDKRYKDIIEPAIQNAGLNPYRVDEDPSVDIPINYIERGIINSIAVIADISEDNPNVWYEVGFARASEKPLVMICSKQKQKFPFDIQHRSIIIYSTESFSDFTDLKNQITEKLIAVINFEKSQLNDKIRKSRLNELASNVMRTPGKDISLLEEILQSISDSKEVDNIKIGRHRGLTPATIDNIVERSINSMLIENNKIGYSLTNLGNEMLNYLSSYLRPERLY
jgi:hypothetical protein